MHLDLGAVEVKSGSESELRLPQSRRLSSDVILQLSSMLPIFNRTLSLSKPLVEDFLHQPFHNYDHLTTSIPRRRDSRATTPHHLPNHPRSSAIAFSLRLRLRASEMPHIPRLRRAQRCAEAAWTLYQPPSPRPRHDEVPGIPDQPGRHQPDSGRISLEADLHHKYEQC